MVHRIAVLIAILASGSDLRAENGREILEVEIDANIDDVWRAFTTTEGLKTWAAPLVEIDFRVGGKWRANYNEAGELGDETTIENTILSYDPKRMLSLKATKFPEGFPFIEAAKNTWSVFYFAAVSESRTKVTVVGLGYTDDEQSQRMRAFFALANKQPLDKLNDVLTKSSAKTATE